MSKIAYVIRGGLKSWIAVFNEPNQNTVLGPHTGSLRFSSSICDAAEFVDDAAVLSFLAGKDPATLANGQLFTQNAGQLNYGKQEH